MEISPFENPNDLETLAEKTDAALFCFGSNSKKKPHNLILGRIFNKQVLDMIELGISHMDLAYTFGNIPLHAKPCLFFFGELFEFDALHMRFKNLLIDFFTEND